MSSSFTVDDDVERACLKKLSDILTSSRTRGERISNNGPAEVVNHLFVGSGLDAVDRRLLNRLRITHVLNCTTAETIGDYSDVGYPPTTSPTKSFTVNGGRSSSSLPVVGKSASAQDVELDVRRWQTNRAGDQQERDLANSRSASCRRFQTAPTGGSTEDYTTGSDYRLGARTQGLSTNYSSLRRFRSCSRDLAGSSSLNSYPSFSSLSDRNSRYSGYNVRTQSSHPVTSSPSAENRTTSYRYGTPTATKSSSCTPKYYYLDDSPADTGNTATSEVVIVKRGKNGNPYDPTRTTVRDYLEIHSDDTLGYPLLKRHYHAVRRFIDSAQSTGGRALIHCELGINRSVTLAVAYLMDTEGVNLTQAVRQLRLARPNVLRNEGFRKQLIQFAAERKLIDATLYRRDANEP